MIVIPAIDIRDGNVVRLLQGDFDKETVYSADPVNMAIRWEKEGAEMLHIIDLDGAFLGKPKNLSTIKQINASIKIPIELGGGLRTEADVDNALSAGASRVILGTRAYNDKSFVSKLIRKYRDAIALSLDAVGDIVISDGWKTKTNLLVKDLARAFSDIGIALIIFTDISKDGMMQGPNLDAAVDILKNVDCDIIISGGISSLEDIKQFKNLNQKNLKGIIVGKALYEGAFTLRQANNATEA